MHTRLQRRSDTGFTLIELLIVVAIIAIIAAILIPNFLRARRQAVIATTKANLKNIATVIEEYYVDHLGYPAGLGDLLPTYAMTLPARPDGTTYDYVSDGGTPPQDYVLCDSTTDTVTNAPSPTTWYWMPRGGLRSVVGGSVNVGFGSCPP